MKALKIVTLLFFMSSLMLCAQEIPQLDTLTLMNGLKIYLLQCGESPVLNVQLVINGGKKNETACQVGYSDVIRQLISETLNQKQSITSKKENVISCEIIRGQTILGGTCLNSEPDKAMSLLSVAIINLSFNHDKIHKSVASVIDSYTPENMSPYQLATVYKNLVLYGAKNPLGRTYCQYQLQKMLPGELKEFYVKQYTPKGSSLLVCGNFNVNAIKKTIATHFGRWRAAHKEETPKEDCELKLQKIKNKDIAFINKPDAPNYLLNWIQQAPCSKSPDNAAFLVVCNLFDRYLTEKTKEQAETHNDTLKFKPVSYTTGFMEFSCIAGQNEMTKAIKLADAALQSFHTVTCTETDLTETVKTLKDRAIKNNSPKALLSFYNPLLYNFDTHKNHLTALSAVTLKDVQLILKKYFAPDSYKLIIVGKAHEVSGQLNALERVTKYQTADFETCDESCIVLSKKKWKKGRNLCCFKCWLRGWCPCMYSPARLQ